MWGGRDGSLQRPLSSTRWTWSNHTQPQIQFYYRVFFPACIHSNIRHKLPHIAVLIDTETAPPERENFKTSFTLFNQESRPEGTRLRSGYWSLWVGWLVPPCPPGDLFPRTAMRAWGTHTPVKRDSPGPRCSKSELKMCQLKTLSKVLPSTGCWRSRSWFLAFIWTKEGKREWNWKVLITVFINKFQIWGQHYDLNLSLQQENNGWRIRTTLNMRWYRATLALCSSLLQSFSNSKILKVIKKNYSRNSAAFLCVFLQDRILQILS